MEHFFSYLVQDRPIILQSPKHEWPFTLGDSFGPKDAKVIDLANLGEEPKSVWIATSFSIEEKAPLVSTLKEYRDVFAWSYKKLKGVDQKTCRHTIPMQDDAKPS